MKKKLVHIISSLKRGGAESLLVDLLSELPDYEHHVLFFHNGPNRQRLEKMNIHTYHIQGIISLYDPVFFIRLLQQIRKIKPNCIHSALWVANFSARIIAKILKIPLVSVIHLGVHQDGTIRNLLDYCTFKSSKKIVAVSQEVADSLVKKKWVPAERISVITNGISVSRKKAEAQKEHISREQLAIPNSAFVIGAVGRFIERKNFPLLLHAFAQLHKSAKNSYLILVGFGPLEATLRNITVELKINNHVRFIVGYPAYGFYPLFDCFVLPSLQEGMSIALLEAMCFSLPCVVTSAAKDHEVIQSEYNGLVIPSNDQLAMVAALKLLASNERLGKKLGENALKSIHEKFSMETMAKKYNNIFARECIK